MENLSEVKFAGFWIRFAAFIIDALFFVAVMIPFDLIFSNEIFPEKQSIESLYASNLMALLYEIILTASVWQATIGKKILGLKVVDANFNRLTIGKSIGRFILKIPSFLVFCLGFFWVGLDKKKRGWHDIMAGTYVVKN